MRAFAIGSGLLLALVACRSSAPVAPSRTPLLEGEDAATIRADVAAVNAAEGVEWRALESHRVGGLSFERYAIEEGVTLLLVLGGDSPAVTAQVWFATGERDDGDDVGKTAAILDAVRDGASVPGEHVAGVAWHLAYWSTTTTPEHLEAALDATIRRREPTSAWARIEAGRDVWSNERLRARVERAATQRPTPAALSKETVDEAARVFAPARATLVLAGDVERRAALASVARRYGEIEAAPREPIAAVTPTAPRAPFEIPVPGAVRRGYVWWPLGEASAADHVAVEAIGQVVAARIGRVASPSGIVAIAVRHRPGATGALTVEMELGETMTATAAAARVREVVEDLGRGGTTGREVERALSAARGTRLRALASLEGRAASAARALLEYGSLASIGDALASVDGLSERDLRRVAEERLAKRRPTVLLTRPERSGP